MRKNAVSRWQSMVLAWAPEKSRERHAYGSSRSLTGRWRKQHNALMWCARRHVNDAWRPVQIYQVLDPGLLEDSPRADSEVGGHAGPGSEPFEQRSHAEQQLLATIGRNQLHGHRGPGLWVEPGGNRDRRVTGVVPGGGVRRVARAGGEDAWPGPLSPSRRLDRGRRQRGCDQQVEIGEVPGQVGAELVPVSVLHQVVGPNAVAQRHIEAHRPVEPRTVPWPPRL